MIVATRIRWRIAASYVVLIGAVLTALGAHLVVSLRASGYEDLEAHLRRQAALVADHAQLRLTSYGPESLDPLAKRLGVESGSHITFIDRDGAVLGDSDRDPRTTDNHASRPEVAQALGGASGQSIRYSSTLDRHLLYVAVPIRTEGGIIGVARVALPVSVIDRSVSSLVLAIVGALVVASVLSVLLAMVLGRITTRPIAELTDAVRAVTGGDLDRTIPVRGRDEVSVLARAFAEMASTVRTQVRVLDEQRSRLAAVLRDMADGAVVIDRHGVVSLVNPAAGHLLGVAPPAAEGRPLAEALRDHELALLAREALSGSRADSRVVEVGPPGAKRVLQAIATRIPEGEGTDSGALLILQDVTELRRVDAMRREFVANVSHELRTPVASIKALVETLEDGAIRDPAVADDFLGRMHVEVDGLAQLVEELLEISRIESGRRLMDLRPVDLAAVARVRSIACVRRRNGRVCGCWPRSRRGCRPFPPTPIGSNRSW